MNSIGLPRTELGRAPNPAPVATTASSCPLCGDKRQRLFLSGPDRLHGLPGIWTLVQCVQCALVYQSPRVADDEIVLLYPAEYEPFQTSVTDEAFIGRELRRTTAFVNGCVRHAGRLLDVGCGAGDFLYVMRQLYPAWEVAGIEPNGGAAARAAERGLDVQQGTLDDISEASKYDVITLWNVLEHVPDPLPLLYKVRDRLASGGMVCLAVPVYDSWEAHLFGRYWVGWELPRHMVAFNRRSIVDMLNAAGLRVVQQASMSGTYYGFVQSAALAIGAAGGSFTIRRITAALLFSRPMRVIIKPYVLLAERFKRGTVLTIAAQRSDRFRL